MHMADFHNGVRVLLNIDRDELVDAGVLAKRDEEGWRQFRDNPHLFFIRADTRTVRKLWAIVQARNAQAGARQVAGGQS